MYALSYLFKVWERYKKALQTINHLQYTPLMFKI
jgi:hypothetical protein